MNGLEELERDVTAAEQAHGDAAGKVELARQTFDQTGTDKDLEALTNARAEADRASEFLARAKRLLGSEQQRQATAEREQLESELQEIERQLSQEGIAAAVAPLDARETAARLALVDILLERSELCEKLTRDVFQHRSLCARLDLPSDFDAGREAQSIRAQVMARSEVDAAVVERRNASEPSLRSVFEEARPQ